jgi:site-specific DNA-cytosine methylase
VSAPLCIDLFCGLGGWAAGFLAEGYRVIGFDLEALDFGTGKYPGQLVLQDVMTLHGSQFRGATVIVASPPCQAYSYRSMPWRRARALPPPDNTLFHRCFEIARQAGVPVVVENVRGAEKWVGRANARWGSIYLWGDVPALLPIGKHVKAAGANFNHIRDQRASTAAGGLWRHNENFAAWRGCSSGSEERRRHTAAVSVIPFPLAQHLARVFRPEREGVTP